MRARIFLGAFLKFRNLGLLAIFLIISSMADGTVTGLLNQIIPGLSGLGGLLAFVPAVVLYLVLVGQTLMSKEYHEEFNRKEKIRKIRGLNTECSRLANEAKRHTNSTYLQKLRRVMEDKTDIVNSFFNGSHSYIKERIVEQTLTLVQAYIKLLANFCIRSKELSEMDVSDIASRINTNMRKLSFTKDPLMAQDIKNLIEMDERIVNRLKEEKKELERIGTKLDYMESTVNMFKHQIISSIESEEMVEKLESAVNEAVALDSVLEERRRNRIRM